jgi:hypothetical protein
VLGPLVEVRTIGGSELGELTLESFEILRNQDADPFDAIPYTVECLFGNLFLSRWIQPFRRVSFLIYNMIDIVGYSPIYPRAWATPLSIFLAFTIRILRHIASCTPYQIP